MLERYVARREKWVTAEERGERGRRQGDTGYIMVTRHSMSK